MNIWFDLANSPHVVFFRPFLDRLRARQEDYFVTLRDFSQTVDLARRYGIEGTVIGGHGGRSWFRKGTNLVQRSRALTRFTKPQNIDVAVSHNSYTQILTARLSHIRAVTLMDYEGQPTNHLAFRLANRVIVPEAFPDAALRRFGAHRQKVYKYRGFKEQVYLSDFTPEPGFEDELRTACGLDPGWRLHENILVVLRPPATMAVYHRFGNPLFTKLLEDLNRRTDLTTVVLPRTAEQRADIAEMFPRIRIPNRVLPGDTLIHAADLVISAGGTMNREAAVLGTPAATIFAGEIPAIDRQLIELGRLLALREERDFAQIRWQKKPLGVALTNPNLCTELLQVILAN